MKTHTMKGGEIIDMMLKNLGLGGLPHAETCAISRFIITRRSTVADISE